jgi:dCTP deaminase
MSVLTRDAILRELSSGRLRLEPFDVEQVGPASIDLHLGEGLRIPVENGNEPIEVTDDSKVDLATRVIPFDRPHLLLPGQTVHGITRERIFLPPDVCGWLEGRSRIARLGLTVHVTSGFVQPGVSNHQVLEMSNVSGRPLLIHPGIRICQIVLQRCEGEAVYSGQFAEQRSP